MTLHIQIVKKNVATALAIAAFGILAPAASARTMGVPATHYVNYITRQIPCDGTVVSQLQHPGGFCGTNPYMPLNRTYWPAPRQFYGYGPIR